MPQTPEETIAYLEATKATLLSQGWLQGAFGNSKLDEGAVCLVGAISRVTRHQDFVVHTEQCSPAYKAIRAVLPSGASPALWNDARGRTLNQVIDLLDAAIIHVKKAS
jgi:hypothetical protein